MKLKREYSIALVVLGSLGLLIFGINFLKGVDLLQRRNVYHAVYGDVSGVTGSSPVFFRGMKVGQVIRTQLVPDGSGRIAVSFQIDNDDLRVPRDSKVQIYSADLFSRALQIIPGTSSDLASKGDTLLGDAQLSLTDAVGEQIDPLKRKAEHMLANVDSVLSGLNRVLNDSAIGDIDASFSSIRNTLETFNATSRRLDAMIAVESQAVHSTLENLRKVSENLVAYNTHIASILQNMDTLSGTLNGAEVKQMVADLNASTAKLKGLMEGLEAGQGSLGQLMKNDTLYANLEAATHELDLLLEDMRLNPNRYVHFSLFGKKDKQPKLTDSDIDRIAKALREANKP
ncbi:MAG: MlaD family protein [Flavobacteriales bacterium]|jgi:phospholipid/cholesterol/gamma-HCH transport system substrate-binding protein